MDQIPHFPDALSDDGPSLAVRDVAAFFGVSDAVIRNMARTGKITATKIGGQWRFSRCALIGLVKKKLTRAMSGSTGSEGKGE